jgi:hypothetical protein
MPQDCTPLYGSVLLTNCVQQPYAYVVLPVPVPLAKLPALLLVS